ncbi:M23 family metallopeptidase [Paenibacillus odorifer]|uniref:M23 family metallopeptidase n=1 Tax=Paenibacillus odorifer TaxID=189426 RepID=UPI0028979F88|nr:M23 family metallopeptidase [Paenibacillus odorifer]
MDQKSDIKNRRKERIRSLLEELPEVSAVSGVSEVPELEIADAPPLFIMPDKSTSFKEWGTGFKNADQSSVEPDPEVMWKKSRGGWEDNGGGGSNFTAGFIRRFVASVLVFGAVWGVFAVHQPWSYKMQAFISDALSNDMDFTAVRVWYEENFNGAPAFIPIFGDKDEPAQKVAAHHQLTAPIAGSIVQPFASTLKGVEIMPQIDSTLNVTVKSIDMGRILSISKELEGGIRIAVQHSGGVTAEYGHLSGTKLEVDDWVQSGDSLGWMMEKDVSSASTLFFAVIKDKTYIDPTEVVSFD